ncbi:NAD(P)H-binding protein [Thermomonospora catenispora]|uniref:NAD(P)H-binding protein n=1 Tax=Thermomonospora catenispora TaxID=2493090 RepID=UPI001121F5BF|nr:NAD(P)H-binding protein [Thermomonospora catenispora]TNY36230.1 NAD-dependent epimerase/dehydratase family protein [Thermomonospora catenispora]
MDVVIAGGHGKIALRLERILSARGDRVTGLIRNPDHAEDLRAAGAEPVVLDLERASVEEAAAVLEGADAAVFAAGAGPGSGAARKDTVDRAASVLLADAAQRAGVRRFLQISSMGVDEPPRPGSDEVWAAYLRAKGEAERDLRARDLDWVILRPGRLTDDPGTGLVTLAEPKVGRSDVTRDDVAAVLAALLEAPHVRRRTLELVGGTTPIAEAVAAL